MADAIESGKLENEQHELFCQEYLIDLNGTLAYIRAGYTPDSAASAASRLLRNDKIRARIKQLMDDRSENIMVDAHFVLSNLVEVSQRCLQAHPVMIFNPAEKCMEQKRDADGQGVWEFDSHGANKALELIGKHVGLFEKDNKQKALPTEQVFKIGDVEIKF